MQTSVALRISGDSLSPDEITSILQVVPKTTRSKGEVRTTSSGKEVTSKFGLWVWKSDHVSDDFTINDHIDRLKAVFEQSSAQILSLPHVESAWIDVCIVKDEQDAGDETANFMLNEKSLLTLREIGLSIEFTVY